jgi:hypothetical protein
MLTTMHNLGKWDELADALRDELAEYGGLLATLDRQRDAISGRNVELLVEISEEIHEQTVSARRFTNIREEVCARLAKGTGCTEETTERDLVRHMPASARAMFESLIEESATVVKNAKKKAERNTVLLSHSNELNEKLLLALRPGTTSKTYNKRGGVRLSTDKTVGGLDLSA